MPELDGLTAVITGGAQGLGLATARVFVREGANVCLFDRDANTLSAAAAAIQRAGAPCRTETVDITDEQAVNDAVTRVAEAAGRIDVLVNNAAVHELVGIGDLSVARFRRMLEINVVGTFLCTRAVLPIMAGRKAGAIVSVASLAGIRGHPLDEHGGGGAAHYAASKGGVIAFTRSVAKEAARFGIRANCVAPAMMATPMNQASYGAADVDKYAATVPLGRIGEPSEVAEAISFLASARASYITGQILNVDGGVLMA